MKKVALYARVSTRDKQDYQRQINDLKRLISAEQYSDDQIEIFAESVSGYKKGEARPELDRLIEITENDTKYFDCIYTTEISRIGREPTETRKIIDRWTFLQIPLHVESIRERTINKDGNRNFIMSIILQVLIEFANNEAETFKKRSSSGIRNSVLNGIAGGSLNFPYGYTKDEQKKLIIETEEAQVIKKIFHLYTSGKGIKAISGILNQEGIPTRTQITYKNEDKIMNFTTPKKAKDISWSDKQVHDILKNTIYFGERNLKGEKFYSPPIIEEKTFRECQEIMQSKTHRNYLTTYTYLLKDIIKCGCCGRNYYAKFKPTPTGDKVYLCSSSLKTGQRCANKGINISLLESAIFNEMVTTPTLLKYLEEKKSVKNQIENEITSMEYQISFEESKLNIITKRKRNLLNLRLDEMIDKDEFQMSKNELDNEENNIAKRLKNQKTQLFKNKSIIESYDDKQATLDMLKTAAGNRSELKAIIAQFISKVIINNLDDSKCLATIYLRIGGVEMKTTLKLFLNKKSIRKRNHSYFPISKMENDPFFVNNILRVDTKDILNELNNEVENNKWININESNILTISC